MGLSMLDEKHIFPIGLLCFSNPFISPSHSRHYVAFIINLNNLHKSSSSPYRLVQLTGCGPAARTIRENDPLRPTLHEKLLYCLYGYKTSRSTPPEVFEH